MIYFTQRDRVVLKLSLEPTNIWKSYSILDRSFSIFSYFSYDLM